MSNEISDTILPVRTLGKSGINVTAVGCGLWAAGGHWGPTDDEASVRAIDTALDGGVNFFDTADVYGNGHSEWLLAKTMKGRRNRFIVATKLGWMNYDAENGRSQYDSVDKLVAGVEDNLARLETDYVDVIQCHINYEDSTTAIFINGFQKLQQQGKVRAWGVSTGDLGLVRTFNAQGGCATLQIDYSILNRIPEQEVLPYCQANDIGVIVRGGLGMGILTGKFNGQEAFHSDDFRQAWVDDPEQNAQFKQDLATVEALRPIVGEGQTLAQLALRFILAHPAVTTVIPGARNPNQAQRNTAVGLLQPLTDDQYAAIDAVVSPGGGRKIWPA